MTTRLMITISTLQPRHAKALNHLTQIAMRDHAAAFTTDFSQVEFRPAKLVADHLRELQRSVGFRLGAFDADGELVGTVRLNPRIGPKLVHSADVIFMYVRADQQGRGIGRQLIERTIEMARDIEGLEQLELSVSSGCASAQRLYEQVGFRVTGTLKRQIRIEKTYYDLITMWMPLQSPPGS